MRHALVDLIESWEAEDEAIDQAHLDWADAVLEGNPRRTAPAADGSFFWDSDDEERDL